MDSRYKRFGLVHQWGGLYSSIDPEIAHGRLALLLAGSVLRFPIAVIGIMYLDGELLSLPVIGIGVALAYIAHKSIAQYHLSSAAITLSMVVGTIGTYISMPGNYLADLIAVFTFAYLTLVRWWPALVVPASIISLGYVVAPRYMGDPILDVPFLDYPWGYTLTYLVMSLAVVIATSVCTFPVEVSREELKEQRDRLRELESHDTEQTRWFKSISRGTTLGLAAMQPDQTLVWANDQFYNLLGIELDDRGKDKIFAWLGAESRRRANDALAEVVSNRQQRANAEVRPRMLPDKWLDLSITSEHDEDSLSTGLILQITDITDRRQAELELQWQASRDALTGLPNRSQLDFYVEEALLDAIGTNTDLALLFIDLDKFKQINDTLGHEWGDVLLKTVANRMSNVMRHGDVLLRFGGDEFVAVLRGIQSHDDLYTIADRIIDELRKPIGLDGHEHVISGSLGAAVYQTGWDTQTFLRCADQAMYVAKDSKTEHFVIYDESIHSQEMLPTKDAIRAAIENQEFVVFYQPILGLTSRKVVGFEALVRWRHKEQGLLLPGKFWNIVEESGYARRLGEIVMRQACKDLMKNDPEGDTTVSVNVGVSQLGEEQFAEVVKTILEDTGLAASRLVLDVTEQTVIFSDPVVQANLDGLCAMGVKLAMDDFGSTYSTLVALRRYAFHQVKVDNTYVAGLGTNQVDDIEVVRSVVGMAHSMGMTVVGEGVEEPDQAQWLQKLGADLGQGFAIGHPQQATEMSTIDRFWVEKHLASPESDPDMELSGHTELAALFQHDETAPVLTEPNPHIKIEHPSDKR
ncbi:putative bifunctional diguanylate cyclase/phosphodiesterase [Stomatohabitans albus]|uniref:putative bifunctional diguanylate cyclase/phosphodiesterase n=1 Tax=Stomatohabitans albus TaxID=3110766 RepID=UPI00300C5C63